MNMLPLDNQEYIGISQELGEILTQYTANEPSDASKGRIQTLKGKTKSPEVKATLEVIESLMTRNVPLNMNSFNQDFKTEQHYLTKYQKTVTDNATALDGQRRRLETLRSQLQALQSKKEPVKKNL